MLKDKSQNSILDEHFSLENIMKIDDEKEKSSGSNPDSRCFFDGQLESIPQV